MIFLVIFAFLMVIIGILVFSNTLDKIEDDDKK